jgi:hypothetical protein
MYVEIQDHTRDEPPVSLMPLHRFVNRQLDSMRNIGINQDRIYLNMFDRSDVLVKYMLRQFKNDSLRNYFTKWALMGDLYYQYGAFLIKKHPVEFLRYYMARSAQWYVVPIQEIQNEFKSGSYPISGQERDWFGYESTDLKCNTTNFFSTFPYLILSPILNGLMIFSSIGFFLLGGYRKIKPQVRNAVMLATSFWVANFIFAVVSAPSMLRYEIPIMIVNITFGLLQLEWISRTDHEVAKKS